MKTRDDLTKRLRERVLVADGAMGTMLYSHGIYINQSFEGLNLTNPGLVEQIHREYLQAGAELIEANTFGANRVSLRKFGLTDKVYDINQAGCNIARRAIEASPNKSAWLAGSIGFLGERLCPYGELSKGDAEKAYKEQAAALLEADVDLIIIETMLSIQMLQLAVASVRTNSSDIPIIAQLTINEELQTADGETLDEIITCFNSLPVEAVGFNCSEGPQRMLEALEAIRPSVKPFISIMPNAGRPAVFEGRQIYLASPEYFATYAKTLILKGANIIGGCCGTTPEHIRWINNCVRSVVPENTEARVTVTPEKRSAIRIKSVEKRDCSRLARKVLNGQFVVSVEIDPPKGTGTKRVLDAARRLHAAGVDTINIADGPRASARMSPLALALLFEREVGIETLIHYCCRDRNILAMQSDLLAAHILGIRNILLITGDPPKTGDYPYATGVFDLDAIGLTKLTDNLNHGMDLIGNPIGEPTAFYKAVGANPSPINFDLEIARLERKLEAGADCILTQPVYDQCTFERFMKATERFRKPILIGICPLASYRNAEFIHNEIPGMRIPNEIRDRMRRCETPESQRAEGISIARESLERAKPMVQGSYIMPPLGHYDVALDVLKGIVL